MTNGPVRLDARQRAICRTRYRHVATYMDPGESDMVASEKPDQICSAIAAHFENGGELKHGKEYSSLLFPFGNFRAVRRHMLDKKQGTESEDRAIAMEWVETQPKVHREEIMGLLGLLDVADAPVAVKSEVKDEPASEEKPIIPKRERSESEEIAKRPRKIETIVKQEDVNSEQVVKSETP